MSGECRKTKAKARTQGRCHGNPTLSPFAKACASCLATAPAVKVYKPRTQGSDNVHDSSTRVEPAANYPDLR
eukprot:3457134-Amphidinium_carterae.1